LEKSRILLMRHGSISATRILPAVLPSITNN
jgi:hypothetical protein